MTEVQEEKTLSFDIMEIMDMIASVDRNGVVGMNMIMQFILMRIKLLKQWKMQKNNFLNANLNYTKLNYNNEQPNISKDKIF